MSLFISTNICSPEPQIISLQEESPEIDLRTKTSPQSPYLSARPKEFSSSKENFNIEEYPRLKLSQEIDSNKSLIIPYVQEENKSEEESKNEFNFKKFILDTIKNDDELALKDKLAFSLFLLTNIHYFNEEFTTEFNEEECHLSLLNWIWRYNKKFRQFKLEHQLKTNFLENFENFLPNYNKLLIEINIIMELLINILNFFVFLQINSSDILHLKLYEKLFKIKEYIKSYANDNILNLINLVLNKWKTEVDIENETKIISRYKLNQLGIKHSRSPDDKEDKEDTEADSVDYENNIKLNINNNKINYSNLNKKIKNKNIKVSFDLQQNSVIYFKKDDIPFQITIDKQKKDKKNFS